MSLVVMVMLILKVVVVMLFMVFRGSLKNVVLLLIQVLMKIMFPASLRVYFTC